MSLKTIEEKMKRLYSSRNKNTGEFFVNEGLYDLSKMGWKASHDELHADGSSCVYMIYNPESKDEFHVKRILKTVDIAWIGWDSDEKAWLVELFDGSIKLLTTNHGIINEVDTSFLLERINEYEQMIESYNTIFEMMVGCDNNA